MMGRKHCRGGILKEAVLEVEKLATPNSSGKNEEMTVLKRNIEKVPEHEIMCTVHHKGSWGINFESSSKYRKPYK